MKRSCPLWSCIALSLTLGFSMASQAKRTPPGAQTFLESQDHDDETLARRSKTKRKTKRQKRRAQKKPPAKVEIPIDIGVGAIALIPNPPLLGEQLIHPALMLSAGALIDGQTLRANKRRIPKQYRGLANGMDRVRVRPLWAALIPSQVIISPGKSVGLSQADLYGAIWHPFGLGITPIKSQRFRVYAGAHLAALGGYMNSTQFGRTLLLRPGLGAELHAEVEFTKRFAVVLGWSSDVFVPQALGKSPLEVLPLEESLYHLGGPFLRFHFRIPYQMQL